MVPSPRILVVDDEPDIRAFLRRALRRFPVELSIEEATSAEEAIDRLRDGEYDIVITDYRLGQRNGVDVLREAARVKPRGGRILLTGYHEADIAISAINEGRVHRYLEKPLDLDLFQKTMAQVLIETDAVHSKAREAYSAPGAPKPGLDEANVAS